MGGFLDSMFHGLLSNGSLAGGPGGTGGSRAPTPGSQFFLDSLARGTPDYLAMMLSGNFGNGGPGPAPGPGPATSGMAGGAEGSSALGPPSSAVAAAADAGPLVGSTTAPSDGTGKELSDGVREAAPPCTGGESAAQGPSAADMVAQASQLYNAVFQVRV